MRLRVNHTTTYTYSEPVPWALQQLRVTASTSRMQSVLRWEVTLDGAAVQLSFQDNHANRVELAAVDAGRTDFTITIDGEVETSDAAGISGLHQGPMPLWAYLRTTKLTEAGPGIDALIEGLGALGIDEDPVAELHRISAATSDAVRWEEGHTDSSSTAEEALHARTGVCQDHAHIFITTCRRLGIPARYISGYLLRDDTEEQAASHAWAEAHVPDVGWIGFDVSNGISPDERYVRLATGLDYRDAAPIAGIRAGGGDEELSVGLRISAGADEVDGPIIDTEPLLLETVQQQIQQ